MNEIRNGQKNEKEMIWLWKIQSLFFYQGAKERHELTKERENGLGGIHS